LRETAIASANALVDVVVGAGFKPAPTNVISLWFDLELLRYRAPALPLLHEETGRALRRARALRC
jgi:hypothetical protein